MGRYLTPSGAGAGGDSSSMRSQRHVLTASNPALAVPAWAKVARISGVGGGGGGSVAFETIGAVSGGGGGGIAAGALLPLFGAATVAIVIGAAGIGKAAGSSGNGGAGGNTTITAGALTMTLEGANGIVRGRAFMGVNPPPGGYADSSAAAGLMPGYNTSGDGSLGSPSPFGGGGKAEVTAVGNGEDANGYGAGGGGSHGGRGGHGSPGLVIIEFLEAA